MNWSCWIIHTAIDWLPFLIYPTAFWLVVICLLVMHLFAGARHYRINTLWQTSAVLALFMFVSGILYGLLPVFHGL